MSRTYRGRHLPRLRGSPAKLVDAGLHRFRRDAWKHALNVVDQNFPNIGWRERWQFAISIEENMSVVVSHKADHPWVRYDVWVGSKRWYKTYGNRRVRRSEKVLCWKWARKGDDFEGDFMDRLDGWDRCSLT